MTIHTIAMILLWSLAVVFLCGLLFIMFLIGRHSVRDNSANCVVYVKTGRHISKPIKGTRKTVSSKGSKYKYDNKFVFVPADYEENFLQGRRVIYVNRTGQLIATPLWNDKPLTNTERETLIYNLVETQIGAEAVNAIKSSKAVSFVLVAIIALILGAGAVIGYNYMQKQMNVPSVTQNATQTKNTQQIQIKPVEVVK